MTEINMTIPYSPGMAYGVGFNSLTGKVRGRPLLREEAHATEGIEGQTVSYFLNKVESIDELQTQLGISAEVNAQFGLFGASAKFDFSKSSSFNSYSVFMVARIEVKNAFRQLEDPKLDPEAEALLKPGGDEKRFAEQFGDSFIIGMQTGGEFCAVLEFKTTTVADQQSLSGSLQGSWGVGTSAEVSFTQKMRKASESRFLKVCMYQAGGTDTTVTEDIEEVLRKMRTYAAGVERRPIGYSALVIDYTSLDLPAPPSQVDIEAARAVLQLFARHRQQLLSLQNDIDYIRENQDQFVDPDIAALNAAADDIAVRLNALTANARQVVSDPRAATYIDVGYPDVKMPERVSGAPAKPMAGWSAWGSLDAPQVGFSGAGHSVERSPQNCSVYVRGDDGALWQRSWVPYQWGSWLRHNDGFELASDPVAGSLGPAHEHVFARGTDNEVWQKWWAEGSGWSPWGSLGAPPGGLSGVPHSVERSPQSCNVYVRGADGALWQRPWWPYEWGEWIRHDDGMVLASDPVGGTLGADHEHVFVRGVDGQVWQKWWSQGTGWSAWGSLGTPPGGVDGTPHSVEPNPSECSVYVRGADSSVWQRTWRSPVWGDWRRHDDLQVVSDPVPGTLGPDHEHLFARDGASELRQKWRVGDG